MSRPVNRTALRAEENRPAPPSQQTVRGQRACAVLRGLAARGGDGRAPPSRSWVGVILEIGEGLPHVYQVMLGTPEAADATGQIGKFLRARVR